MYCISSIRLEIRLEKYCFFLERDKNLPLAFTLEGRSRFSDLPTIGLDILNKKNR